MADGNDGQGTITTTAADGTVRKRPDYNYMQKKHGSKISSEGVFEKGRTAIVMPKDIDVNTPEGNDKAGKYVKEVQSAVTRGKKQLYAQQQASKLSGVSHKPHSREYKEGWNDIFGKKD
jgi:hypothetical protein|tara:strand:+ start:516 stop:872 length:357 start_codon:yes stop_codon:yes gene_type:complete